MSPTSLGVLVLVAAGLVALAVQHRRARRADAAQRWALFSDVVPLLADARLVGERGGYPVLTGRLDGWPVTLRVIVDAVALRKLPVLWAEVVVHRALDVPGTLNVLLRPTGTEFFSPDSGFAHELAPPAGVPRPVRVSCAGPGRAPSPEVLAPAIELLGDPATKELAVGRGGLRVVLRVAEAEQASYRSTRRAVFDRPRLRPEALTGAVAVLGRVGDRAGGVVVEARS
ncbi:hypothetical protein PHK61_18035 [Actinomycetospora lutea]|uniref:hypothetical protein n=1 Tax=Actinomycetospora lutea TaxID=663604 RepID=UPI002366FDB5|nr:hypothetical protein [Actinomycetospora lutea]MDD7940329.1 hypothetical protein [Actinomycetospora lutea]